MTTWNYRVTVARDVEGDEVFEIREVYYNEAGEPISTTKDAVSPIGESLVELHNDLTRMSAALALPVLDITGDQIVERPLVRKENRGQR